MDYTETRRHELRKRRILMVDGNLTLNSQTTEAGASARTYRAGYWGFASTNDTSGASVERMKAQAGQNAQTMARFGAKDTRPLPGGTYRGEHVFRGRPALSQADCVDRMTAIQVWCKQRYPELVSVRIGMQDEHHSKWVSTSTGSDVLNSIQRAACAVTFTAIGDSGTPVELSEPISAKGSLADLDLSVEALAGWLDELHGHLQAKRHAVAARGGQHTIVLAPELAGILAHEAMGHPCEADIVLGGAVTGDLVGQRIASELVSMIDVAHTFNGQEAMIPVYCDDEGTPARDAVLIKDGVLTDFMSSRETAQRLGLQPTGSARAYAPTDEPLVRMRNTVILPGTRKLAEMISEVDDGYYLMKTANGQADSTTEFMFGIPLAYEIKGGKLGRAIRDTTMSGSAIKVLQSADAVSDDMSWNCSGYCGKKQPMVVSMGGPALRVRAHLGGE
ncbi:TldD/PmbA family protein [Ramlibacter sp. WS9]|uniref:TldD/PmbA family protein n=1 Tax=Ramlibacter sp. WS9 TaxID=1882741 RepID=UPI0013053477|nr:TldD/PmbA family protein [Ramlibacter sp. WS9]